MKVCVGAFDGSSLYCCTTECESTALTSDALCTVTSASITYSIGTLGAQNPFFKTVFPYFWADQKLRLTSPDPASFLSLLASLLVDPLTGTVAVGSFNVPKKVRVVIYDDACNKLMDSVFVITELRLSQRGGDLPQLTVSLTKA